jgi:hypothetical protein
MSHADPRQKAVVAARQVVPDSPELLVHDVEVVEEPLRGGRDFALRQDGRGDVPVRRQENTRVVANPGKEIPSFGWEPGGAMGRGQAPGVLLEALDSEQLGADRIFLRRRAAEDGVGNLQQEPPDQRAESWRCGDLEGGAPRCLTLWLECGPLYPQQRAGR